MRYWAPSRPCAAAVDWDGSAEERALRPETEGTHVGRPDLGGLRRDLEPAAVALGPEGRVVLERLLAAAARVSRFRESPVDVFQEAVLGILRGRRPRTVWAFRACLSGRRKEGDVDAEDRDRFRQWLRDRGLRPGTAEAYAKVIRQWRASGRTVAEMLLQVLPPSRVQVFSAGLRLYRRHLTEIGDSGVPEVDDGTESRARLRHLQHLNRRGPQQLVTPDQIPEYVRRARELLGEDAEYRLIPTMMLAGWAGLRQHDLRHLRWADVDWDRGILTLDDPKGGRPYQAPVLPELLSYLRDLHANRADCRSTYVLVNPHQTRDLPVGRNAIEKDLARLGLRCHMFRRGLATDLLNRGMGVEQVARILNHRSRDTTYRYYYVPQVETLRDMMTRAYKR